VPLNNLMEDAATAEISRAQIWLWINRANGTLTDGRKVTVELFRQVLAEELDTLKAGLGEAAYDARHFARAREIFDRLITADQLMPFLTLPAYEYLA
jgi:malate synthase